MFTGIVEETGAVISVRETPASLRLLVSAPLCATGVQPGDSIAVNGCCLTSIGAAQASQARELEFDLLRETWNRTNLRALKPGSLVNLERSLPASGRLHGHFVTGHIDGTGCVEIFEKRGSDWFLR